MVGRTRTTGIHRAVSCGPRGLFATRTAFLIHSETEMHNAASRVGRDTTLDISSGISSVGQGEVGI
jgi:hypothetical protein